MYSKLTIHIELEKKCAFYLEIPGFELRVTLSVLLQRGYLFDFVL